MNTQSRIFLRYIISGGAATLIHFIVLVFLVEKFGTNATMASAVGFCAAIFVNYALQYFWTFKVSGSHSVIFIRYVSVTVIMLGVNTTLFWVLNEQIRMTYLASQAIATVTVVSLNFIINQTYTFVVPTVAKSRDHS